MEIKVKRAHKLMTQANQVQYAYTGSIKKQELLKASRNQSH